MAVEFFAEKHMRSTPFMSIAKCGYLNFSAKAVQMYFQDISFAILGYDADTKEIVIKPDNEQKCWYSRKMRIIKDGNLLISAKPFLKHFNIDFKKLRRFTSIAKDGKMIRIKIGEQS